MDQIEKLQNVLNYIKQVFVGKNEVIDLLGIALVARENAFLLGPPGTAKSAIVRQLSDCIEGGKNFEYLLTRFTEPNELFGPFDIRKLKEGDLVTNTEGMLPEASLVFLDELFNANSAILNSLLTALNEKIFRRGKETKKLPALVFVGASNQMPEDEALNALLDRFLVRIKCDYVPPDLLQEVLLAGWQLERSVAKEALPIISPAEVLALQAACRQVDLSPIRRQFIDVIHRLRNVGVNLSDRRAVKLQNIIAASALICHRQEAIIADLWVLKHIWDTEEQIEIITGIIDELIGAEATHNAHPQASAHNMPNAEELAKEVVLLHDWHAGTELSAEEQNILKDKLRYIQNRAGWIKKDEHRQYLQQEIDALWNKILITA